jgi:hypothetical protein
LRYSSFGVVVVVFSFGQVDVPSFELPGYWLKTWLAQHQGDLGRMSRCSFKLKKQVSAKPSSSFGGPPPKAAQLEQDDDDFNDKPGGLAKTVAEFVFLPRAGSASTFLFEGHRVWVEERHDTSGGGGGGGRGGPPVMPFGGPGGNASQVFRLTTLGRSKHTICALLAAAKEAYEESLKSTTVIWSANPEQRFGSQAGWQKLDARPSRPMRTVLLEDGVAEVCHENDRILATERLGGYSMMTSTWDCGCVEIQQHSFSFPFVLLKAPGSFLFFLTNRCSLAFIFLHFRPCLRT